MRIFLLRPAVFFSLLLVSIVTNRAFAAWPNAVDVNLPVCTLQGQESALIVSDGNNGAILVWSISDWDGLGLGILAQRIDREGDVKWPHNGVPVTAFNKSFRGHLRVAADGLGGVIVTWQEEREPYRDWDIYAQRLNHQGKPLWTAGGVAVARLPGTQSWPELAADGKGGAFFVWRDQRTAPSDSYMQWLSAEGVPMWKENGINISNARNHQYVPQVTTDGEGGIIVAWMDDRSHTEFYHWEIYAQRFNSSGIPLWSKDGVLIMGKEGQSYITPKIISDGAGGAIIQWHRNGSTENFVNEQEIYVQKINKFGRIQWDPEGVRVSRYGVTIYGDIEITGDGDGGIVLVWFNYGYGSDGLLRGILAQRVDKNGTATWQTDGMLISGDRHTDDNLGTSGEIGQITQIENGDVIITWGLPNLMAQKVNMQGEKKWGTSGVLIAPHASVHDVVNDGAGGAVFAFPYPLASLNYSGIHAKKIYSNGLFMNTGFLPPLMLLLKD